MLALLAQVAGPRTWGIGEFAIAVILIVAVVAVVIAITRGMGVPVPGWLIHVGWIILAAFVGVFAVRLLMSM